MHLFENTSGAPSRTLDVITQHTPPWQMTAIRLGYRATAGWVVNAGLRAERPGPARLFFDVAGAAGRAPGVAREVSRAAGMRVEWHRTPGARDVILYCHGGGFVFGSARSHRGITSALAAATGRDVLAFDYRLAPEAPYPAALDDTLHIYKALLATMGYRSDQVVVAGDSAGGSLALALLMECRDRGEPMPRGAILLCPLVDFEALGHRDTGRDILISPEGGAGMRRMAYDNKARVHSLLHRDVAGLPPILLQTGTDDVIHQDSLTLHERLADEQVPGLTQVFEGMPHVWQGLPLPLLETSLAMRASGRFAKDMTSGRWLGTRGSVATKGDAA